MTSPTTHARTTILTALRADAALIARIPAARLYPAKTPNPVERPFGRYGTATTETDDYSCWDGEDVAGAYHIFAKVDPAVGILDAEAWTADTVREVKRVIHALADCFVVRTEVLQDPEEADLWHGVVLFEMKVTAPA